MRHERASIADATRAVLCCLAAGDTERPLPPVRADWDEVFDGVCRNGLLALAWRYLKQHNTQGDLPPSFRRRVEQAYHLNAIQLALRYRSVRQTLAYLDQSGLEFMIVKGPAVAHVVYPHPSLRPFNDLDVVVRERDWAFVHQLLIGKGFRSEDNRPQPPPKIVPQAVLHESKYWNPEIGLSVEVHYDDVLYAGLGARNVEGFWQRSVVFDLEGIPVKTLSLEDQLIHLCAHAHHHNYTRLLSLSDIAFLILGHGAQLDWEQLLRTVRAEEAQVAVYYSLHFAERLLGTTVSQEILAAVRPDPFRRRWHEHFMPEDQVVSLQPMPPVYLSFYFRPFLKRLLPDLLVMGRRSDKFRYLLRFLVPPSDWLIDHYSVRPPQKVIFHYLLHPLKFLYHVVTDVLGAMTGATSSTGTS